MIDAWLGAVAVALLAVAYVVVGARRRARHTATSAEVDATFAQRRHELEAEARGQGLDAATVEALEEELALDTLDEAARGGTEHSARTDRPPLLHLLAGGLAVAALAVGLYALWGEPYAPVLAQASQLMQADGDGGGVGGKAAALGRLQEALVDRTRRRPNDADSWFFLAHLHMVASDYAAAASAFATLREIAGPSEQIDIAWAQASYLADGAGDVGGNTRSRRSRPGRQPQPPGPVRAACNGRPARPPVPHRRALSGARSRPADGGLAPSRVGRDSRPRSGAARSAATVHRGDHQHRGRTYAVVDGVRPSGRWRPCRWPRCDCRRARRKP